MHRAASITATAAVTPYGKGPMALWRGLLTGGHTVVRQPRPDGEGEVTAALVPGEALALGPGEDRALALVRHAVEQLMASPAWSRVDPAELGICIGTTQGAISTWVEHQERQFANPDEQNLPPPPYPWLADPARLAAQLTGAAGPLECPSMACVSGTAALGFGLQWLRKGRCRWVVAGGVDAFSSFVHHGFQALKALDPERPRPFDEARAGLGAGEGVGLILLEAGEVPDSPRLLGWGLGGDANHLTGPHPGGIGLSRAVRAALRDSGGTPADLDYINAHGTATAYNDLMEARALHHALGDRAGQVPVSSIKGAIGHSMAAAGAVEAVLSCQVMAEGMVPPTSGLEHQDPEIDLDVVQGIARPGEYRTVLSTSAGFGGLNAAVVLGA